MEPVKFAGANANYVADGCDDLPAMVEQTERLGGTITVTSCWKPTEEDLKTLNEGGCVCLSAYGGQPPVSMWVQEVEIID